MTKPTLDHPTLAMLKRQFPDRTLFAAEFRGQTSVVVSKQDLTEVMSFLRHDPGCQFDFLSHVTCADYLNYPEADDPGPSGRFGLTYNLVSCPSGLRLLVRLFLDPSLDTSGTEDDPALHVPTVTDLWPGAEWTEREVYDMFGVAFDGHPDLRRILLWEDYPAHPLRKDYPVIGRGEREQYQVIGRDSA